MTEYFNKHKQQIIVTVIIVGALIALISIKSIMDSGELTTTVKGNAKVKQDNSKTVTSEVSNDNLTGSTKLGNIGSVGGDFTLDQSKSEDSSTKTETHSAK